MSENTSDLVSKIVEANALETAGETEQAIALYQEIIELDRGGNYGDVAQQALNNLQQTTGNIIDEDLQYSSYSSSWLSRINIKAKTSLILIGVALIAGIGISSIAYILADKTIARQTNRAEQTDLKTTTKEVASFMQDRMGDLKIISTMELIANPDLRASSNALQKKSSLNNYVKTYGFYNRLSAFDLEGNPIAYSSGEAPENQRDREYFEWVRSFNQPYISKPTVSDVSGAPIVYIAAPIKDTKSGYTMGVMVGEMSLTVLTEIIDVPRDLAKTYLLNDRGQILLSSEAEENLQITTSAENSSSILSSLDFYKQLESELNLRGSNKSNTAANKSIFYGSEQVAYLSTFNDLDSQFLKDLPNLGWSVLVTIDRDTIFAPQKQLLQVFAIAIVIVCLLIALVSRLVAARIARPIIEASEAVKQMGEGDLSVKLPVKGEDELADLGRNINKMAEQIEDLLSIQEAEARQQRQEKELLQQGVMSLLLDVEGAQQGDLTIRAQMSDGAIGSIADAFNATMGKLRRLLQEVQTVSGEVGQLSMAGENSVRQLSESALSQTEEINDALSSIDQINQSVETVANYAQEAAKIARNGAIQAKEGDLAMDATVDSIEKIRRTVANTAKKVKQLAESSQEIAQIVEIISGISEKTNLLAFNASVEAARAGEHGEGFRIVAEEVRRLADRITEATKDIQQLVGTIQLDTSSVLQGIETSTSEVVNGSELVRMTKTNLRSLADTSKQIDEYLKYISTNTIDQTNTSQQVNQKISGIAILAKTNSTEARNVVQSLRTLVSEAENLQSSISQFKLEA
jgi:twitching motility protein PilJ